MHCTPHLGVHHELLVGKLVCGGMPAAGFDAAHRHNQAALLAHQDGGVQHPVLLGADELLAVEDEDARGALIDHPQLGHRAAGADLGDVERAGAQRCRQRLVARPAVAPEGKRHHREAAVRLGLAQPQRAGEGGGRPGLARLVGLGDGCHGVLLVGCVVSCDALKASRHMYQLISMYDAIITYGDGKRGV